MRGVVLCVVGLLEHRQRAGATYIWLATVPFVSMHRACDWRLQVLALVFFLLLPLLPYTFLFFLGLAAMAATEKKAPAHTLAW